MRAVGCDRRCLPGHLFHPVVNEFKVRNRSSALSVILRNATVTGTTFTGADLSGVVSGGIVGTAAALPTDWSLIAGFLIGPGTDLEHDDLYAVDLTGVDLVGADLQGTNLSDANLTNADLQNATVLAEINGVTWSNTTCPDGTNSDNDANTCANNLTP